jgi:hypothetical protein
MVSKKWLFAGHNPKVAGLKSGTATNQLVGLQHRL